MNEANKKRLPGRLMLLTAAIFFVAAITVGHSGSKQTTFIVLGAVWLNLGIFSLSRARRKM
jgi:hypothetical protein